MTNIISVDRAFFYKLLEMGIVNAYGTINPFLAGIVIDGDEENMVKAWHLPEAHIHNRPHPERSIT